MVDISFWNQSLHMLAPNQIILWFRVAVTGCCGWHTLTLAQSLVVAEGQFWWSLSRQDGIVGRADGGGALRLISRAQNTPDWVVVDETGWCGWRAAGQVEVKVAQNKVTWHLHSLAGGKVRLRPVTLCAFCALCEGVCLFCIVEGFSSSLYTGCVFTEAGTPASC